MLNAIKIQSREREENEELNELGWVTIAEQPKFSIMPLVYVNNVNICENAVIKKKHTMESLMSTISSGLGCAGGERPSGW